MSDDIDLAQAHEEMHRAHALAAIERQRARQTGLAECRECGEDISPLRQSIGAELASTARPPPRPAPRRRSEGDDCDLPHLRPLPTVKPEAPDHIGVRLAPIARRTRPAARLAAGAGVVSGACSVRTAPGRGVRRFFINRANPGHTVNITIIAKAATTINVHSGRRPALPFAVMRSFGDGASDPPPTQLEWSGTIGDSRMTYAEAEKACAELRLGGHDDWRLPTLQELQEIVDYSRCNPAIDTTLFPDTKSEAYWTASPVASAPDSAWIVDFYSGNVHYLHRGSNAWARAVRGPRASQ